MDYSSTTSHLNGDHAEANGSSQACFSSIDTKSIDSSHSLDIRNGDYIDLKQKDGSYLDYFCQKFNHVKVTE